MHAQGINPMVVAAGHAALTQLMPGNDANAEMFAAAMWSSALLAADASSAQPKVSPATSVWLAAWMREEQPLR